MLKCNNLCSTAHHTLHAFRKVFFFQITISLKSYNYRDYGIMLNMILHSHYNDATEEQINNMSARSFTMNCDTL